MKIEGFLSNITRIVKLNYLTPLIEKFSLRVRCNGWKINNKMLKINVSRKNSDTHLLCGTAVVPTGREKEVDKDSSVSICVDGESWHSYPGAPGYQGFDKPYRWGDYPSVKAAEAAGWRFGRPA
jgi:hypothetical protein